ncbi:MAG: DUF5104 domain-containing protein [Ruminococcus sp.]|nr:DUF5104 domain-containing protein [Ruminococcus sp.]
MKKPRLFSLVIILLVTTLSLTSCDNIIINNDFTIDQRAIHQSKQVYKYLKNQETRELKELFCEKSDLLNDLTAEIEGAYEFIDGEIISCGEIKTGSESASYRRFKVVRYHVEVDIYEVITDTGYEYNIYLGYQMVDEEEKDIEGLLDIDIIDETSYESAIELYGEDEVDINDFRYVIGRWEDK